MKGLTLVRDSVSPKFDPLTCLSVVCLETLLMSEVFLLIITACIFLDFNHVRWSCHIVQAVGICGDTSAQTKNPVLLFTATQQLQQPAKLWFFFFFFQVLSLTTPQGSLRSLFSDVHHCTQNFCLM